MLYQWGSSIRGKFKATRGALVFLTFVSAKNNAMDCPCPNAGGKTRKTPRPYGVAKGLKRRRREQIRGAAGTCKWAKVAGEFSRHSALSFAVAVMTKPKLHLRIRCCCFCLSLQPEAARRKFYLIYARVAVMPVKPIEMRIQALCHGQAKSDLVAAILRIQ